MQRFLARPGTPLRVPFDPIERLATIPHALKIKGMFFNRVVSGLGDDLRTVAPALAVTPRLGAYMPFSDYPFVDYLRLSMALAKKRHPTVSLAEAIRVLERDTVQSFAESTVGRVVLNMASDLRAAILRVPDVQRMVVQNGSVTAEPLGERAVRVAFHDYTGWLDCAVIGNLEGAVMMYRESPAIDVDLDDAHNGRFDISW